MNQTKDILGLPHMQGVDNPTFLSLGNFCVCWSAFEWKINGYLNPIERELGTTKRIKIAIERALPDGFTGDDRITAAKAHFADRYIEGRRLNLVQLDDISLTRDDQVALQDVLNGDDDDETRTFVSLLVLAAQIRHLTIHGEKWRVGIQEFQDNFYFGSEVFLASLRQL